MSARAPVAVGGHVDAVPLAGEVAPVQVGDGRLVLDHHDQAAGAARRLAHAVTVVRSAGLGGPSRQALTGPEHRADADVTFGSHGGAAAGRTGAREVSDMAVQAVAGLMATVVVAAGSAFGIPALTGDGSGPDVTVPCGADLAAASPGPARRPDGAARAAARGAVRRGQAAAAGRPRRRLRDARRAVGRPRRRAPARDLVAAAERPPAATSRRRGRCRRRSGTTRSRGSGRPPSTGSTATGCSRSPSDSTTVARPADRTRREDGPRRPAAVAAAIAADHGRRDGGVRVPARGGAGAGDRGLGGDAGAGRRRRRPTG